MGLIGLGIIMLVALGASLRNEVSTTELTTTEEIATTTPPSATSITSDFNHPIKFLVGENKVFSDELSVTLESIDDSRCPLDVQCIWAGELAPVLVVQGSNFGNIDREVRLGTSQNKSATVGVYIFTLLTATETTATIQISKTVTQLLGEITGTVSIGPICPVERIDEPCVVPPETYTTRNAVLYDASGTNEISRAQLDTNGNYKISVTPGKYMIQIQPAGIGAGEMKSVTIVASKTVVVDFDIDTGIR